MDYEEQEPEYNEVHTGTGKLLLLFVGLVMVCAVFFGLGYTMGKTAAVKAGSLVPDAAAATPSDASKPSPAVPADSAAACPQGQDCSAQGAAPASSDQMTFYKSVEQKDANAQLSPPATAAPDPDAAAAAPAPAAASKLATPEKSAAPVTLSGYSVQVAAVTKPQDAQALVDALHQKQYPAFVTSAPSDKLLHVQVGPFSDLKDAQAMKARLAADGYNPILKK
ncbi:MAG TPA: SPOR domain-containing protein [Terriglobales bacterium]|nr:SPOR domain-containing protein [Terriglobales bacterium]